MRVVVVFDSNHAGTWTCEEGSLVSAHGLLMIVLAGGKRHLRVAVLRHWTVLLGEVLGVWLNHLCGSFIMSLERLHIRLKHFYALDILLTSSVLRGTLVQVHVWESSHSWWLLYWYSLRVVKWQTAFASSCSAHSYVLDWVTRGLRYNLPRSHVIRHWPLLVLRLLVSRHCHCLLL